MKHVDNSKGDLELDAFKNGNRAGLNQAKQELIDILDALEKTIKDKMHRGQEDEINSSSAAADYQIKLESEIEVFTNDADKQEVVVAKLQLTLDEKVKQSAACKSQQNELSNNLEVAKKDLLDQTNKFNKKNGDLSEEISIFNEVLDLYV